MSYPRREVSRKVTETIRKDGFSVEYFNTGNTIFLQETNAENKNKMGKSAIGRTDPDDISNWSKLLNIGAVPEPLFEKIVELFYQIAPEMDFSGPAINMSIGSNFLSGKTSMKTLFEVFEKDYTPLQKWSIVISSISLGFVLPSEKIEEILTKNKKMTANFSAAVSYLTPYYAYPYDIQFCQGTKNDRFESYKRSLEAFNRIVYDVDDSVFRPLNRPLSDQELSALQKFNQIQNKLHFKSGNHLDLKNFTQKQLIDFCSTTEKADPEWMTEIHAQRILNGFSPVYTEGYRKYLSLEEIEKFNKNFLPTVEIKKSLSELSPSLKEKESYNQHYIDMLAYQLLPFFINVPEKFVIEISDFMLSKITVPSDNLYYYTRQYLDLVYEYKNDIKRYIKMGDPLRFSWWLNLMGAKHDDVPDWL